MKPNDKAIEAEAVREVKSILNTISPVTDNETIAQNIVGKIIAAYTAQFHPSEDYAGLIKLLRSMHKQITSDMQNDDPCLIIDETVPSKAADALEAVLADRDALLAVNAELSVAFKERDEAIAERDALKAELAKAQEMARVQAERIGGYIKTIEDRDALLARLAPVEAIENDKDDPTREYIPLPGGWEIQTKGKGSSYRLLDKKTGERHMILTGDEPFVQEFVTRMAKEINASAQVRPVAPVDDDSRYLTTEEQKVFNSALRRSAKSVAPAPVCEVHAPSAMWADGTHQSKDDEALVEIAFKKFNRVYNKTHVTKEVQIRTAISAAIDAIRPHIEAAAIRKRRLREERDRLEKEKHWQGVLDTCSKLSGKPPRSGAGNE